jgi:hypothetical protein
MYPHRLLIAILVFPYAISAAPLFAQFGAPELQALQQLGCKVGQALPPIAEATGQSLAGTNAVYSFQGLSAQTVPPTAYPGIYQVRAYGKNGLSNSRGFMVTPEPWVLVTGNESEVTPAAIAPGTIWQDECPDRGRNYYRLKSETDQNWLIQTFAYSLDSRARLVLSLLNADRVTIATCSATNDRDASLSIELKANTEYVLMVHDHLFRGGGDYRYALKLESSISKEHEAKATPGVVDRWRSVIASQRDGDAPGLATPILWQPRSGLLRAPTDAPVVVHEESQFEGAKSMQVAWPTIVAGQWDANDDIDSFDFECEAKTDISVELISQRLGELSDGFVIANRVENLGQPTEKLTRIAENDDGPGIGNGEMRFAQKDSLLTFQTTEKGTVRLQLRNQQRLDRSMAVPRYAIEIRKPNPGFVLCTHSTTPVIAVDQTRTTSPTLCSGGAIMISVHALRFDNFAEPIELNVTGLPNGFRGGSGVIGRDQNFATLNVWSAGTPVVPTGRREIMGLEIHGSVEIGQQSIGAVAVPLEVTWSAIDTYRTPIAKAISSFQLAKADSLECPVTVELGPRDVDAKSPIRMDAVRGQSLKIPVRITRRTGGEVPITVRLHHSPPKTTVAEIKIDAKATDGVLELLVPKDAPVGEFMLGTLCEAAIAIPNADPTAKEKTKSITLQLPSSSLRVRIGDAP